MARINPEVKYLDYYRDDFQDEIDSDPAYYGDVTEEDMMAELARPKHVPWLKQAYCKYTKGLGSLKISLAVRSAVGSHSLGSISHTNSLVEKENSSQQQQQTQVDSTLRKCWNRV